MSVKDIFIKIGNWQKSSEDLSKKGGLSLKRAVRYMLGKMHVPFVDDCCDTYSNTETITDLEGALSESKTVSILNPDDTASYTMADGYAGEIKYIENISVEDVDITITGGLLLFTSGQNSVLLWSGTEWVIIGGTAVYD